jgi:hypothetical protein
MASYPWIVPWKRHGQNLDDFPNLKRWFEAIHARPAVIRAYAASLGFTSSQLRRKRVRSSSDRPLQPLHEAEPDG